MDFVEMMSPEEQLEACRQDADDQAAYAQDMGNLLQEAEQLIDRLLEQKKINFDQADILRRFVK
jgi:hypothetical protein